MTKQPAGPVWIDTARKFIGSQEIVGPKHASFILQFWHDLQLPFNDDETPWCAGFVGAMLLHSGYVPLKSAWALDYNKYGVKLDRPAYGCIAVYGRHGGGHVNFIVGKDANGNLMGLGGNQANAVNIKPFDPDRVIGYRWPGVYPFPVRFNLPLLKSDGTLSTNEA